jgi:hypothetical protein
MVLQRLTGTQRNIAELSGKNGGGLSVTRQPLSDAAHGSVAQVGLVGPLGRGCGPAGKPHNLAGGPAGGPTAVLSYGDSALIDLPACHLRNPGASGGGSGGQRGGLPGHDGGPVPLDGRLDHPRAASVLRAVGVFMARQKASPGRGRRTRRGSLKKVKSAPETAPLFREPAFAASGAACSSPCRTTARIEGTK